MKIENYTEKTLVALRKALLNQQKDVKKWGQTYLGSVGSRGLVLELAEDVVKINQELTARGVNVAEL